MIPIQLTLRNFLSYRNATLDFRGLATACVCGANGAGKSSLLEGMSWAIWGQSRVESEDDVIHQGETEAQVEFIFQLHESLYRIIRTRCRRQGMALEFQVSTDFDREISRSSEPLPKTFRPLTEKGIRATQQLIIHHVKLDYETFVNSAYLRQGRADEFMLKRPSDRKQILADLLKLNHYDDLADRAKEQARQAKAKVDLLEQQKNNRSAQLLDLPTLAAQQLALETTIAQLQQNQTGNQTRLQTLRADQQQQQNWRSQLQWHQKQQQQQKQDCDRFTQEYHQAESHTQALVALLDQEEAICSGYVRWQQLQAEEEFLGDRFTTFQQIQAERHQYQQQQRDRIHQLEQRKRQLETQENSFLEQLEEMAQILEKRSEIEAAIEKLKVAKQDLKRFDQVQLKAAPLLQRKYHIQREIDRAAAGVSAQLATLKTSVQQFEQRQSAQPHLRHQASELNDRIEELEKLRKYQERVRDKGLERRTFMEKLQSKQREAEVQLAEVNQILSLLKHQTEDAELNAKLREVLAKHHADLSRELQVANLSQRANSAQALGQNTAHPDNPNSSPNSSLNSHASSHAKASQTMVKEAGLNYKPDISGQRSHEVSTHRESLLNPSLNGDFPPCPLCDRPLDEHHWQVVVEKHLTQQQEILDEIWIIREQLAVSEREIQVLRQEYRDLETKLIDYPNRLQQRGQLQAQLQSTEEVQIHLDRLQTEVQQLETQLLEQCYAPDLQEELRLLEQTLTELDYDDRNHAIARGAVERWRWAEVKAANLQQTQQRQTQITAKLPEIRSQLESLGGQIQDAETDLTKGLAEFNQALETLGYSLEQHNQLRSHLKAAQVWQLRYQDLLKAQQQLPQLQARLEDLARSLQSRLMSLEAVNRECQQLQNCLLNTLDVSAEIEKLEAIIKRERQSLDQNLSALGRLQQQRQQQQHLQQDLLQDDRQLTQARQQLRIYQELTQAFGKNGIQALLIENILPQLETLTNQVLTRLTNNQLHVQFVTQRRTGKAKAALPKFAETLDILIADAHSTRPYETYSGGEAFRINFAIRLALARLLSQRSGTALQMLIVDEGFGTQDQEGCDRLIAAINAIASDFACILTVTHMPYFRDAFQARIEVTKTDNGSKIFLQSF